MAELYKPSEIPETLIPETLKYYGPSFELVLTEFKLTLRDIRLKYFNIILGKMNE